MGKTMNQNRICSGAVFSVWSGRAVERWQGKRFELVRRMGQTDICRNTSGSLFQRGEAAMAMERLGNLSDEVTQGRNSVRVEEERVERGCWIVNS